MKSFPRVLEEKPFNLLFGSHTRKHEGPIKMYDFDQKHCYFFRTVDATFRLLRHRMFKKMDLSINYSQEF